MGSGRETTNGAGGKTACSKTTIEVDPKDFEVDADEVHPTYVPTGTAGAGAGGQNLSEVKAAGKEEQTLTENLMLEALQKTHMVIREKHNDRKGHEGHYELVPVTPKLTGCKDLLAELHKCGITRVEQLNLVCVAYESWFEWRYLASFDEVMDAEDRACHQRWDEEHGKAVSGKAIYIPQPIQCPLVVFRKEMTIYLEAAREQLDDFE